MPKALVRIDALSRTCASAHSRRRAVTSVVGGMLALLGLGMAEAGKDDDDDGGYHPCTKNSDCPPKQVCRYDHKRGYHRCQEKKKKDDKKDGKH